MENRAKIKQPLLIVYILLLCVTLGAVIAAGALSAPVIFNSEAQFGEVVLSHFQEGLLMTAIFLKLNYLIHLTVIAVLLMELYRYKMFDRDTISLVAMIVAVFTGLLFTQYYTPDILAMQSKGAEATQSAAFDKIHFASELDFKLFALALLVLAVRNMQRGFAK